MEKINIYITFFISVSFEKWNMRPTYIRDQAFPCFSIVRKQKIDSLSEDQRILTLSHVCDCQEHSFLSFSHIHTRQTNKKRDTTDPVKLPASSYEMFDLYMSLHDAHILVLKYSFKVQLDVCVLTAVISNKIKSISS